MSKSKEFIEQRCYQFGNPVQPVIFKTDALEAVEMERKEIYEAYRKLCPCYRGGICKSYPHVKERNSDKCDMDCKYIQRLENSRSDVSISKPDNTSLKERLEVLRKEQARLQEERMRNVKKESGH